MIKLLNISFIEDNAYNLASQVHILIEVTQNDLEFQTIIQNIKF